MIEIRNIEINVTMKYFLGLYVLIMISVDIFFNISFLPFIHNVITLKYVNFFFGFFQFSVFLTNIEKKQCKVATQILSSKSRILGEMTSL